MGGGGGVWSASMSRFCERFDRWVHIGSFSSVLRWRGGGGGGLWSASMSRFCERFDRWVHIGSFSSVLGGAVSGVPVCQGYVRLHRFWSSFHEKIVGKQAPIFPLVLNSFTLISSHVWQGSCWSVAWALYCGQCWPAHAASVEMMVSGAAAECQKKSVCLLTASFVLQP